MTSTLSLGHIAWLFALFLASQAAQLHARNLLGNNFGVPTINATYDYVVIGGGNAGLTVASRLSEDPSVSVAVLEAGSFYEISTGNTSQLPGDDVWWAGKSPKDVNPLVDWGFVTTPQAGLSDNQVVHYARGKTLGGCTARNYMAYQRATKDALQMWADEVGDDSWTFDGTAPFYQRSLNFTPPDNDKRGQNATPDYDESTLGIGQPLDLTFANYAQAFSTWIQKAFQTIGINPIKGFTSGELIGSSWIVAAINHTTGARESSETAFLQPALGRDNFYIYVDTLAKKILFDGTRATGVEVSTEGYIYSLTANKEVIVSAGVFKSPQMLMVSGIGPSDTLQGQGIPVVSELAGVGQNMWDHLLFGVSYRVNVQTASCLALGGAPEQIELFQTEQSGIFSSPGGDFAGYEKVPDDLRANFTDQTKADLAHFPDDWPEIEYLVVGAYFGDQQNYVQGGVADGYQYATIAPALVAPMSRGNISISSPDTAVQPVINPNWLADPTDQQVAVAAFKRARQAYETDVMTQNVDIGPEYFPGSDVSTDDEILHFIQQNSNTVYHASSTCKMGKPEDPMAVVDSQGKVFGVEKLRVVDASIMPFLPPGLPMGTVYMLAEKIVDDIRNGNGHAGR